MVLRSRQQVSLILALVLGMAPAAFSAESAKEKEKRRQQILERMEALRKQKEEARAKQDAQIDKIDQGTRANRIESIKLFERVVSTTQKDDPRRADALFQLGALYYEDEREAYIKARDEYETKFHRWEKAGSVGDPPVAPVPGNPKAIDAYKKLVLDFPAFPKRDVVLYKVGNIATALGDFDMAFESFKELVDKYPKSDNVPFSRLRIGEYYYMKRDHQNALKNYEAVGMKSGADNYLLSLYRIASCHYNLSQFEKAIDRFYEYVELANSGKYKEAGLKDEAVEYLAISFSELEGGAQKALNFFEGKGGRPYQDQIIFTIGMKNRDHDNVTEAVRSLSFLLNHNPNYIDAPIAVDALIDCYVVEKEYEKANGLREKMIRDYGPGSKWERSYPGEAERIAKTKEHIREAASIVPIFYHRLAMGKRDSGKVEEARSLFNKALQGYADYMQKFPDEVWNIYTFHLYRAELLNDSSVARYEEAATEFDWVSRADTSRYPDRLTSAQRQVEEQKKKARDIKNQFESDVREQVKTVVIKPEESAFAALLCYEKLMQKALKARGLADSTAHRGFSLPETQKFLSYIKDFRGRFPKASRAAEVSFLEANIYFAAKDFAKAIEGYRYIVDRFPGHEKVYGPSLENLAKGLLNNGQYEDAIATYRQILNTVAKSAKEKADLVESISAAMFQLAQSKQKSGDYTGSADIFKRIIIDYPDFSRGPLALFNAAFAYEEGKMYLEAGREFERVFDKFPNDSVAKKALLRSAKAYQTGRQFAAAAQIFLKYRDQLPGDSQAVPCIFRAANMYDSAGDFIASAKAYEMVYEAYQTNQKDDKKFRGAKEAAPQALYSAGLIYEKAKKFNDAIRIYQKLEEAFSGSPDAPEAVFSVAICFDSLGDARKMAESYVGYTKRYGTDKARVVFALMKAAKAYEKLGNRAEEEALYREIITLQKSFGEKYGIDPVYAAEAYYILGERAIDGFSGLDLKTTLKGAAGKKEVEKKLKAKTEAIRVPLEYFTNCIALQADQWTTRATFMCGEIFWNFMESVRAQSILEKEASKAAYAKVKINEALPPYYEKAMGYYYINVDKFGNKMGVKNEWVDRSAEKYGQAWYQIGFSHVENGEIFSSAPNPFPAGTQEHDEYQAQIKEIVLKLVEKCVPTLEAGIKACTEVYISNSWVEKMKKELSLHDANNAALQLTVKEAERPKVAERREFVDHDYERAVRAIQNVYQDRSMPVETKIVILRGMETRAQRDIERLTEAIKTLNAM